MKTTKSITLHNLDNDLYTLLLAEAETRETSLNVVAKDFLTEAVGLSNKKKKRDLSWMVGLMSKEEGEELDKYIEAEFEQIDPEDWK